MKHRSALARFGAALILCGLAACGARSDGPAPLVLGVPPAAHYYAAAPARYQPQPSRTAAWAAPQPPPRVAADWTAEPRPAPAPAPVALTPTPWRRTPPPVALAALPPREHPAPARRPVARDSTHDSEAMAEVKADIARAAAAEAARKQAKRQEAAAERHKAAEAKEAPVAAGAKHKAVEAKEAAAAASSAPEPAREARAEPAREARFRWPVHGRILEGFGTGPGGTRNDGINIAAPKGAPVQAAASGVVAYAGNELRGYGNLLLIKHAGGWISAYAHCDVLLAHQGQKVARGQVVARVGSTGNVTKPQLHFELRHDSKPVDPLDYLGAPPTAAAGRSARPG